MTPCASAPYLHVYMYNRYMYNRYKYIVFDRGCCGYGCKAHSGQLSMEYVWHVYIICAPPLA